MNILITRPLIDSEDLMGKLFSLGHRIVHIPTLKISASNVNPVDAKKYDAFIFTSANAIRNLKLNNQDNSKICFCVGSITEKIVRQKGYNNTISAGGTVTFTNTDTAPHTSTSGSAANGPDGIFDTSLIMMNASYDVTLSDAGTYTYFCMVHPWMEGTIIVE